jgi:tRNA threonylcarbamoyladenosine biosynthesis protein TsaE
MVHKQYSIKQYYIADTETMQLIGQHLANNWLQMLSEDRPRVWYLTGELGAGKTTFSQAFIKTLMQDATLRVKSPTYTLVESYESDPAACRVLHADLYRLVEPEELEYLGFRDLEMQADVLLIEWPSKGQGFLPKADVILDLSMANTGRYLTIKTFECCLSDGLACFE